jgi:hypothetical protein
VAKADASLIFGLTIMVLVIVLASVTITCTLYILWRSWRPKDREVQHEDISWDRRRPGR